MGRISKRTGKRPNDPHLDKSFGESDAAREVDSLCFELKHEGARQIFCAALTGILAANDRLLVPADIPRVVILADAIVAEVQRRGEKT